MKGKLITGLALLALGMHLAHAVAPARMARGFIVKLKTNAPGAGAQGRVSVQSARSHMASIAARARVAYVDSHQTAGLRRHVMNYQRWIESAEARAMATRLRADPDVEWVEPNYVEQAMALPSAPNDPYFAYETSGSAWWQWYLRGRSYTQNFGVAQPGAPDIQGAWSYLATLPANSLKAPVVVAVLDSGVRLDHPDLIGQLLPGYDFVSDAIFANDGDSLDADPSDPGDWVDDDDKAQYPESFNSNSEGNTPCYNQNSFWHGSVTTGLLAAAADNNVGISGTQWPLKAANSGQPVVLPIRVAGKCGAARSDIIEGMYWAAGVSYPGSPSLNSHPARVISLSYGGASDCGQAYQETVDALARVGVLVVTAAGNGDDLNGAPEAVAPANCSGVLAVTALRRNGSKAAYANLIASGSGVATVGGDDYVVSGSTVYEPIISTANTGATTPDPYLSSDSPDYYLAYEGTSFATPLVAGVAAMMISLQPQLSPAQLISGLSQYGVRAFPSPASGTCAPDTALSTGNCNCTTATCGAGVLDAVAAVQWAASQSAGSDAQLNQLLAGRTVVPAGTVSSTSIWSPDRLLTANAYADLGEGGGGMLRPAWALGLLTVCCALQVARRRRGRAARP